MTNREKFETIFGFKPTGMPCLLITVDECKAREISCIDCNLYNFWDKEYQGDVVTRLKKEAEILTAQAAQKLKAAAELEKELNDGTCHE